MRAHMQKMTAPSTNMIERCNDLGIITADAGCMAGCLDQCTPFVTMRPDPATESFESNQMCEFMA